MNYKIVTDSSADVLSLKGVPLGVVPLHILVGEREFIDDEALDMDDFLQTLDAYNGKSSTSCPSPQEWETAFDNAPLVFCVTVTSGLSGSYRSAMAAKDLYESTHPERKVFVVDSLSAGPELILLLEKIRDLLSEGLSGEQVYSELLSYQHKTHLCFSLASVDNFAKNGRVSPLIAKGVGILGIRILGQASAEGTLEILDKCRGDKRAYQYLVNYLKSHNYAGGTIYITHNNNPTGAEALCKLFDANFPGCTICVQKSRALVSYYAEPGSLLVGFESV